MFPRLYRREWLSRFAVFAALALPCTGCASLDGSAIGFASLLGSSPSPGQEESASGPQAVCHVEFRKRRTKRIEVPVKAEMRVQDTLEATKMERAFRRPEVAVFRRTSNPSEPVLKLVCQYDHKDNRVELPTDYAILPGDTVIVRESKIGPVDEMLSELLGLDLGTAR